jgi:FtsZ-interacting cell division protein YlmF
MSNQSNLPPPSAVAERALDETENLPTRAAYEHATALIAADRRAVRAAAIRECIEIITGDPYAYAEAQRLARKLEPLLTAAEAEGSET